LTFKRGRGLILVVVSLALIAAACGSSSKNNASSSSTTVVAKQGGDLVVAAEQDTDCMDWIGSCAGAAWGVYMVQGNVMPKAYDFTDKSVYAPSPVLTGEATLVTSPAQVITYHINPKAVWSDGQPITSTDFKYTWTQITTGKDIYDTTGYVNIASVDDTDPHTAVVTFKTTFVDWKGLFGAFYGIFPSHILAGKDRDAAMKDGFTWSGGPWMLDHWTKGTEVKLVPNPQYWGKKPNLNSLTFKIITDTASEQSAVKSGQVSASYPQAQPGQEALRGQAGLSFDAISGLSYEGLWFQTAKFPLDSKAVRQALAFATDRAAIVNQLFAPVQPDIQPIQSVSTPAFGKYYSTPFSKYHLDLAQVTTLMTGDGWAKGSDGIWAKGGKKATLELKTTVNNKRRHLTAQILQSQWQAAGFGLTINEEKSSVLFGQDGPAGNFQVALFAQTPSDNDPAQCVLFCTKNIPTAANGNSGTNWYRISDPALDTPWQDVDTDFNDATRTANVTAGQAALADLVPVLPVDPFPDIVIVDSTKVASETGTFRHNFAYGPFLYANEWFLK
jgi:peptide/nickel transport system substrate-binding protein